MTLEEQYQITNQVLKELSVTAKRYYTKDTVLTVGVVRNLIELSIARLVDGNNKENPESLNLNPDEEEF